MGDGVQVRDDFIGPLTMLRWPRPGIRIVAGPLPFTRLPAACHPPQRSGGGPAGHQREEGDGSASGLDDAAFLRVEGREGVVGALGPDVGLRRGEEVGGTDFVEEADGIDAGEGGDEGGAIGLGMDGAGRAFELAHGEVAVDPDEEAVAKLSGGFEIGGVPDVEEVETAIGHHHPPALVPLPGSPGGEFLAGEDFVTESHAATVRSLVPREKQFPGGGRCRRFGACSASMGRSSW